VSLVTKPGKTAIVMGAVAVALVIAGAGGFYWATRDDSPAGDHTARGTDAGPASQGVSYHGRLAVEGTSLVDQNGQPVQLRGVSSHGITWYPRYGDAPALDTVRQAGANVFRIAMYTDGRHSYQDEPDQSFADTTAAADHAMAADLYAIIDWHTLSEKDPNVHIDQALDFFDRVSAAYREQPGVIYEICNEPNGGTTWDDVRRYANRVIPVIRANSPEAVILVGTPHHSTGLAEAAAAPLDFSNVLYAYHYYADLSGGEYAGDISRALSKDIGVFVSEWGIGNDHSLDEPTVRHLLDESQTFLNYLDAQNISWVSWSLSNKDEGSSLLRADSQSLSGWSDQELTPYGQFVFARLRNGRVA